MIVSDAPNCGITYDRHYDDRNSFIIQATGYTKGGGITVPLISCLTGLE